MEKVKKQLKIIFLCFVIYIINFLIAPIIFENYYPISNEANFISAVSVFSIAMIGMLKISDGMVYWLIGDILYCFMIFIYDHEGAYGIGLVGFYANDYSKQDVPFGIAVELVFVILLQIAAEIVVKIIKVVQKRLAKNKNQNEDRIK